MPQQTNRRQFDEYRVDERTGRETPTGKTIVLSWEGAEPTQAELAEAFRGVFGRGTFTAADIPAAGATAVALPLAISGFGIPAMTGGAAIGGALGKGLQQMLTPSQVGRLTVEGAPRGSLFGVGGVQGTTEGGELDIEQWYPGRTTTPQERLIEIGGAGGFEGALEGALGVAGKILRPIARIGQRVATAPSGQLLGQSDDLLTEWSLNQGLGPMGSRAGRQRVVRPTRTQPSEFRPGRVDPMTGQRFGRGREIMREIPFVRRFAQDPVQLSDEMTASAGRARQIADPYKDVDVLQGMEPGYEALRDEILASPVGRTGQTLGEWVKQGETLNFLRDTNLPPELQTLFTKYMDPARPFQLKLTMADALKDKSYLETHLNAMYDAIQQGQGTGVSTALATSKALRDFLSRRIEGALHAVDPRIAADFITQNKQTQVWGDLISLVRESDPSLVKQMGLGFAATGSALGGSQVFGQTGDPMMGAIAAAASAVPGVVAGSPPLQSFLSRRLWDLSHGGTRMIPSSMARGTGALASQGALPPTQGGVPSAGPTIQNAIQLALDNPQVPQPQWLRDLLGTLVPTAQAAGRIEDPRAARTRAITEIAPTSQAAAMRRQLDESRLRPPPVYGYRGIPRHQRGDIHLPSP